MHAGYHLGVLNTCLHWVAVDLDFDETKGGSVVVSAALVGAAVGALLAGQFADAVGPKKALVINNVSLIVGCVLCAWAPGGLWAAIIGTIPILLYNDLGTWKFYSSDWPLYRSRMKSRMPTQGVYDRKSSLLTSPLKYPSNMQHELSKQIISINLVPWDEMACGHAKWHLASRIMQPIGQFDVVEIPENVSLSNDWWLPTVSIGDSDTFSRSMWQDVTKIIKRNVWERSSQ